VNNKSRFRVRTHAIKKAVHSLAKCRECAGRKGVRKKVGGPGEDMTEGAFINGEKESGKNNLLFDR